MRCAYDKIRYILQSFDSSRESMTHILEWMTFLFLIITAYTWADTDTAHEKRPPERLDAVKIQAVETFSNPRSHEISFGVGILPLDAYYFGFGVSGGYTYYLNQNIGWEVLNLGYVFSVQKDLTSQLADKFGAKPETIEKLEYLVASSLVFTFAQGKSVLFGEYLQRVRSSLFIGPGFVKTSQASKVAANLGARFDTFIGDSLTWRLEVRDHVTLDTVKNYVAINLETQINF